MGPRNLLLSVSVLTLASIGCAFFITPVEANLSDSILCRGWDTDGQAIVLADSVPPTETRICACGYLQTNQSIWIQTRWSREGEEDDLLVHRQMYDSGPFLTCIEQDEDFERGNYWVTVTVGKTVVAFLEFSVGVGQ